MIPITMVCRVRAACKPRASGDDPTLRGAQALLSAVNPARAGMIRTPGPAGRWSTSKPRASGDDPAKDSSRSSPML